MSFRLMIFNLHPSGSSSTIKGNSHQSPDMSSQDPLIKFHNWYVLFRIDRIYIRSKPNVKMQIMEKTHQLTLALYKENWDISEATFTCFVDELSSRNTFSSPSSTSIFSIIFLFQFITLVSVYILFPPRHSNLYI